MIGRVVKGRRPVVVNRWAVVFSVFRGGEETRGRKPGESSAFRQALPCRSGLLTKISKLFDRLAFCADEIWEGAAAAAEKKRMVLGAGSRSEKMAVGPTDFCCGGKRAAVCIKEKTISTLGKTVGTLGKTLSTLEKTVSTFVKTVRIPDAPLCISLFFNVRLFWGMGEKTCGNPSSFVFVRQMRIS